MRKIVPRQVWKVLRLSYVIFKGPVVISEMAKISEFMVWMTFDFLELSKVILESGIIFILFYTIKISRHFSRSHDPILSDS